MMKKTIFPMMVGFVLTILSCLPQPAMAQQVVAAIIVADLPRYSQAYDAMVEVLRAGGFDETKLKIFTQKPNADKMSLINSLRRCQSANVNLVVTFGSRATAAAMSEPKDIHLLFADVYDPVALGVVKNLAAPGADATGATSKTDLTELVATVQKIRPLQQVGVIFTEGEAGAEQQLEELRELAAKAGFKVEAENARNPKEALDKAVKLASSSDALYLTESIAVGQQGPEIVKKLASSTLIFSQIPGLAAQGALAGLEADPDEQGKLVAVQVLQILQGQKALLLPVRSAKKVGLFINQDTATALGVTVPAEVASQATLVN